MIIGWQNLGAASGTTITSSTETSGFEDDNAVDYRLDDWWKPTASAATITFDLGSAQSVDYIGIAGHNLGTNSVAASWRYSTDNFSADDNEAVGWSPSNDSVQFKTHTTQSKRYWRLRLTYAGSDPSVGHISFGARYAPPVGARPGFVMPKYGTKNKYINSIGDTGLFIGRSLIRETYAAEIDMALLTAANMRTDIDGLLAHVLLRPFFLQWDNTNYPAESAYCWLTDDPRVRTDSAIHYGLTLQVRALV